MLSFGIEYDRALAIAAASEAFAAGSGPPSLAATMIARDSLVKSLPRFLSSAPFLCLIVDHFEWPLMPPPPRAPAPPSRRSAGAAAGRRSARGGTPSPAPPPAARPPRGRHALRAPARRRRPTRSRVP